MTSCHVTNNGKSTIFSSSTTQARLNQIVSHLHFKIGSLPFTYLGVPIFKEEKKPIHLQPIEVKIRLKLSNWKASLLSMAGRIQPVKSVIHNMLTYNIAIYSWPISLLKDLEKKH